MSDSKQPHIESDAVDFDELAIEQEQRQEPDQLDGPAFDLDRPLDGSLPE